MYVYIKSTTKRRKNSKSIHSSWATLTTLSARYNQPISSRQDNQIRNDSDVGRVQQKTEQTGNEINKAFVLTKRPTIREIITKTRNREG